MFIRPFDWLPLQGVGAEIGVAEGRNAASMLHRHPEIRELHLVDPYIEYHQERDRARAGRIAHKRMAKFGSRVQFHRCSVESANLPMLDFAYIAEVKFNRQVAKSAKAIQIRKAGL